MSKILLVEHPVGNTCSIKSKETPLIDFINESSIQLPEGVNDDAILIKGPVQRANVENKNRRIYPRAILDREMKRLQEIIKNNGGCLGELDHPDAAVIGLKTVPIVVRKLWWDQNDNNLMMAIVEILDPKYNISAGTVYSILKAGLPLGISSRGLGSVETKNNISIVQEDFELLTFDIVSDPSTHGAFLRHFNANKITENTDKKQIIKNNNNELTDLLDELILPW